MKIERLEFVCHFGNEDKGIVKIDLGTSKVTFKDKQLQIGEELLAMLSVCLELLNEVIIQNNADKCLYIDTLDSLARAICCYIIHVQFCYCSGIDEIIPKVVMNIEYIE